MIGLIILGGETVHLPFTWHDLFIYGLGFATPIFLLVFAVIISVMYDG